MKDTNINIKFNSDLKAAAQAQAAAEGRTLSNWIEQLVIQAIVQAKKAADK
jgi:predicted HicB family RNase H-like nuclease